MIANTLTPMYNLSLVEFQDIVAFDGYNLYNWYEALRIFLKDKHKSYIMKDPFLNNLCKPVCLIMMFGVSTVMMLLICLKSY